MGELVTLRPTVAAGCSFCGEQATPDAHLIRAFTARICENCAARCLARLRGDRLERERRAGQATEIKYPDGHGWNLVNGQWVPY